MKNVLICLTLILMFSCQPEYVNPEGTGNFVCDFSNPLEELVWLKAKIEETRQEESSESCQVESILLGAYSGQTVFIPVLNGAICCTCGNTVYNCEGEVVFSCDQGEEAKIRNKKVNWQSL